jgi:hypothetical protein
MNTQTQQANEELNRQCRDFDRDRCRFDLFEALADAESEARNL